MNEGELFSMCTHICNYKIVRSNVYSELGYIYTMYKIPRHICLGKNSPTKNRSKGRYTTNIYSSPGKNGLMKNHRSYNR